MIRGIGYGKIIFFGEHFVVYGAPAIAGGISSSAIVEVKKSDKNRIITDQKVVQELSLNGIQRVLTSLGVTHKYDVHLKGDLPTYGGLGSSAAFCVALTRAIAQENDVSLTDEEINRHAYEGEKAFHGNPSGIDNIMATYGGVVEFKRGKTQSENKFELLHIKKPLHLVISFSGKYSATAKMVEGVRKFKEQDGLEFSQLMDEYLDLLVEGRKSLENGDIKEIGKLMDSNQSLLSEIGVSDELNDKIIEVAREEDALGAKVTGGGGGGCCIALAKNTAHADQIAEKLKGAGFDSFCAKIAEKGHK